MVSSRSAQQAHRDAINVQRMLSRLEVATEKQQHEPSTSYTTVKDYYKTLSTLSSIKNAKKVLDESVSDANLRNDMSHRLDKLESHYKTIFQNTPKPHHPTTRPDLEHLRPVMPLATAQAEQPPLENNAEVSGNKDLPSPELQAANDLLPLGEDESDPTVPSIHRRRSSFESVPSSITPLSPIRPSQDAPSKRPSYDSTRSSSRQYSSTGKSDTPATTQSLSNLLSHHRSEQESLTEELATMASRLKLNSLEFSQLLEKDKSLLENAEEQLDGNLSGMIKERDRLKAYKKTGGVTTWFVIGAVLAVLFAWLFMFAIMRVF